MYFQKNIEKTRNLGDKKCHEIRPWMNIEEYKKKKKEYLTSVLTCDTIVGRMEVGLFFMPKIR